VTLGFRRAQEKKGKQRSVLAPPRGVSPQVAELGSFRVDDYRLDSVTTRTVTVTETRPEPFEPGPLYFGGCCPQRLPIGYKHWEFSMGIIVMRLPGATIAKRVRAGMTQGSDKTSVSKSDVPWFFAVTAAEFCSRRTP
jgi:hypothetical protein